MRSYNKTRQNGFAIITALLLVLLVASSTILLMEISKGMLFESNREFAEAETRNLTASALAWMQVNTDKPSAPQENSDVVLDVTQLQTSKGSLRIAKPKGESPTHPVKITTRSCRGRMNIERSRNYKLVRLFTKWQ